MTSKTESPTPPKNLRRQTMPRVNRLTAQDVTEAFKAGFADFLAHPVMSSFFGLFYAAIGILVVWSLFWLGQLWVIIPAIAGFPLVTPFAAAGLYEMSRRRQANQSFGWAEILGVVANQRKREMGWMAFVTLFVFWVWIYQIRLWLAVILRDASFSDFGGFLNAVFFTPEGWLFLTIGTGAGAILSAVLFSVTVIAMPMLLDRETDFVTAMITSVKTVKENPVVMLGWAAVITLVMIVSLLPAFLGLILTLPILGHTTWHLYQRAIPPVAP